MDLQSAKITLEKYYSNQDYRPEDYYPNVVNVGGRYLGPYIPYVGDQYFDSRPKLLIYAMAQNLARIPNLISKWLDNEDHGLLRHYYHSDSLWLSLHPYDTGHLKIIAAIASFYYPGTDYQPSDNIHKRIAITNFVKFSFLSESNASQRMDTNPPVSIYADMWKYYCEYEVRLLQPDMIIGVGDDVYKALKRNLRPELDTMLIKIPFPGRLNLNAQFIPKGKRLIKDGHDYHDDIERIKAVIEGTPDEDGKIVKAINTDWYYFVKMETYFNKVLSA